MLPKERSLGQAHSGDGARHAKNGKGPDCRSGPLLQFGEVYSEMYITLASWFLMTPKAVASSVLLSVLK